MTMSDQIGERSAVKGRENGERVLENVILLTDILASWQFIY